MAGTLYLVPTPIGNLGDISPRAAQVLGEVDFIAAEDTRVTLKLLNHLGLKKSLVSYYRHNTDEAGEKVLERLMAGDSCALVTDAGTPAVSDPGEALVALCAANGAALCAMVARLTQGKKKYMEFDGLMAELIPQAEELRQQVRSGQYRIDARETAARMLLMEEDA